MANHASGAFTHGVPIDHPAGRSGSEVVAEKAADLAAQLYADQERESRKRRFTKALRRAGSGSAA